jgi:UDP-N-acetylglucosamine 2-epimerase (non-hydrolysing)
LRVLTDQPRDAQRLLRTVADYTPVNVSDKVLRIILSYTGFVRRRVWGLA